MFTVIRLSNVRLENLRNRASLGYEKEWGLCVVHSDKNRLKENTVMTVDWLL